MTNAPHVFQNLESFGFVHHRALNTRETFEKAVAQSHDRPDLVHVLEGDLCWHLDKDECFFYFRHPKRLVDVLSPEQIRARHESGNLFTLDDLIEVDQHHLRYIIELKVGRGNLDEVTRRLVGILQDKLHGRFWLDGFSIRLFHAIKTADSTVPTSLHSKMAIGPRVLRTSVDWIPFSLPSLHGLDCIDAVTLTYKTSMARFGRRLGMTIDQSCAGIMKAGKNLILGGLTTPEAFERASSSAALAGYAKFPISHLRNEIAVPGD